MTKPISSEQLTELHARYMSGEQLRALEQEVGYSKGSLLQAFRLAGLPRGRPRVPLSDPRAEQALALWDQGVGTHRVAAQTGLSWSTVLRLLRESGRDPSRRAPGRAPIAADDPRALKVIELWDSGMSRTRVAAVVRLAPKTVARILHDSGRNPSQRRPGTGTRRSDARVSMDELRALHARYLAGESVQQLSAEAGYGKQGLTSAFSRNGLPLHGPGPQLIRADNPRALEAFALWDAGGGFREVAEQFGFQHATFSRLLTESGRDPSMRRRGPGHHKWKGGRSLKGGYVVVRLEPDDPMASMRNANGEVLEHRLVMARALGRPLTKSEQVHHVDEPKTDNRLTNLQLRQGQHGAGHAFRCADCGSHNIVAVQIDT